MLALPLFKKTLKFKGFPLEKAWNFFSQIPGENLLEWQNEKKWEIVRYHLANNPFYKEKLGTALTDEWESLPILKKADFQANLPTLLANGYTVKNTYTSNTSGSAGNPLYFAKDYFSHALSWALIEKRYAELGICLDSRQARFYGIPLDTKGYFKEKLKDYLSNRFRFVVFDLSDSKLSDFLRTFKQRRFEFIYGYTNSLLLFARFLIKHKITLAEECPTLKVCIVTSELCTEQDTATLKSAFGVPVVNEYGASEFGVIAIQNQQGVRKLSDELLFVEVLDDQGNPVPEGQTGNLVITSLFNKAMPFIRYQLGDLGTIKKHKNYYHILSSIQGRENDTIYLPSGKVSPGFTFYYLSKEILEKEARLKEFTIRQLALDHFEFHIATDEPLAEETKTKIANLTEKYLEKGLLIDFVVKSNLERDSSGKLKHFYSDLQY